MLFCLPYEEPDTLSHSGQDTFESTALGKVAEAQLGKSQGLIKEAKQEQHMGDSLYQNKQLMHDCRYFGALYLIIRSICFFVFPLTFDALGYAVCLFLLIVFAKLIAIIQPYIAEYAVYNTVDTVFIIILPLY